MTTRLALISDLHATTCALDAVLAELDALGIERIVCLGDIVDLGPEPGEVVDRLRERDIPCIRGNHDRLDEQLPVPRLRAVEDWTREQLSPEQRAWLDTLPTERWEDLDGCRVWCVHGSPDGLTAGFGADTPPEVLARWAEVPWDVLACGHTHVQCVRRFGSRTLVNVGSVAQPFAHAREVPPHTLPFCDYAVLEASGGAVSVQLRRRPLPLEPMLTAYRRSTFPDWEQWVRTWRIRGT